MSEYTFSVIIPAHNEEKYIGKCLEAIETAAKAVSPRKVQVIVVANRCTDNTAAIAEEYGAKVLINEDKCISSVRNCGVNAAEGEIIVTIDADSRMTKGSLAEIEEMLHSGKFVGGGTRSKFDRMSIGIFFSAAYVAMNIIPVMKKNKAALTGGMFWFYKKDFEAIGGFDESLVSLEDLDFAARLNKLGVARGQKYGTLKRSYIITSSRKFDEFGDWYLIKNRKMTKRIFTGKDREAADEFYYDVR
ncbi:MAG: glycosyltransferase [Ruminiclostridium sp.]